MSDPRRWLDPGDGKRPAESSPGPSDAAVQLLGSQKGFRPLDAAAATRIKRGVAERVGPLASPLDRGTHWATRQFGRGQFGPGRFTTGQLLAATVGAGTVGGLLAILVSVNLEPDSVQERDAQMWNSLHMSSSHSRDEQDQAARRGSEDLQRSPAGIPGSADHAAFQQQTPRDPWSAELWGRWQPGYGPTIQSCFGLECDASQTLRWLTGGNFSAQSGALAALDLGDAREPTDPIRGLAPDDTHAASSMRQARARDQARVRDSEAKSVRPRIVSSRSAGDPRGLREETVLLEAARSDLARNPKSAFATAQEHQVSFPNGQLASQRTLIQVEALLRLGQDQQAVALTRSLQSPLFHARAEDLLKRYGAVDPTKN
jgi:hypothetical protein